MAAICAFEKNLPKLCQSVFVQVAPTTHRTSQPDLEFELSPETHGVFSATL